LALGIGHYLGTPLPISTHPHSHRETTPLAFTVAHLSARLSFAQDSNQTLLPLIPEYAVQTLTPQEMLQVEQRMDQRRERLRDKCSAYGLDVLGGSASGLGSPRISIPNLTYRSRLVAHPEHVGVSGQQKVSHYLVGVNFIHFSMNPF